MSTNPTPNTAHASDVKEVGRIVYDVFDEGIRFIILRGPYHWCGYVGVPLDHPLAGFFYDDLTFVEAHGGLTFAAAEGIKGRTEWPSGYYWYGWDYGHAGDRSVYDKGIEIDGKDWTIQEVIEDSVITIDTFKSLVRLTEKIKRT